MVGVFSGPYSQKHTNPFPLPLLPWHLAHYIHTAGQRQATPNGMLGRFIAPLSECELNLTSIIEELTIDPWPTKQDERPMRCTGVHPPACVLELLWIQVEACACACGQALAICGIIGREHTKSDPSTLAAPSPRPSTCFRGGEMKCIMEAICIP